MLGKIPLTPGFLCLALSLILSGCGTTNTVTNTGSRSGSIPGWVRDPYTRYDRQTEVAAVGAGSSREVAEKNAFGSLVAFFGQSVQFDDRVVTSYREAVENGVTASWSENTDIDSMITISAGLDSLVGAEIRDVWNEGRDYYAVAVLNKANSARIYSDIVRSNQRMIDNLVNIPESGKDTLEGYARYQFAATVADMTIPYVNLLSVIGGPVQNIKSGNDYRLEAINITKAIPVALRVRNDKSARIEGAFARALSDLGFQSGGSNSRYLIDVNIVTSAVEYANNTNKYTRIEVTANLVDAGLGTVLLPYNFNTREGHQTQAEADNRAYMVAEQKINNEYSRLLSGYLSSLMPKR